MSVEINELTKIFGQQVAVDHISFSAVKGMVTGFLGPNGAGKSTTMKMVTSFIPPTSGSISVCGYDVVAQPLEVKKRVGYLPEHNPLYLDMYVHEYLQFVASLHQLSRQREARVKEVVGMCGLTTEQNKKIGALSKGYRQRVGIAQTLLHNPEVLILDEPTTGLDPNQIIEIRKLIKELGKDKTVIFSSHILQEVEAICDQVIIINKGKLVANSSVQELLKLNDVSCLYVRFNGAIDITFLKSIPGVSSLQLQTDGSVLIFYAPGTNLQEAILRYASERDHQLAEMKQIEQNLESIFRMLTIN
ncbi:MAG TPA: gliding motility-associated ABC transporter ATP-binding subunit GldA [Cytophagaceae bacterium]|nr:gliding motility-associated ABC transporter ATP-binding subunit GldA [Cytophagaceae bacterium]